ncbi:MAG: nucleotidyltransferase domain-containing protein [Caldilineaceae bacterium]|nr:nucleotidyltransferase domain-containing protein [Caldilineaceae bacterium]
MIKQLWQTPGRFTVQQQPPDFAALARRFDDPGVRAVALMGSHARGDAGPFSDVDLMRLVAADSDVPGAGSHLIDGNLVVVSNVPPGTVARWFTDPVEAVKTIAGLRVGRALIDREGLFAQVQTRAHAFVWTPALQAAADAYAGEQMVGLIEEVHKGLEGLRRDDVGRLLNARFGLSWLLSHVMQVQRGVLVQGDNAFFDAMTAAMGVESLVAALSPGVRRGGGRPARDRDRGLHLYCECAHLLAGRSRLPPRRWSPPPCSASMPNSAPARGRGLGGHISMWGQGCALLFSSARPRANRASRLCRRSHEGVRTGRTLPIA